MTTTSEKEEFNAEHAEKIKSPIYLSLRPPEGTVGLR